MKVSDEWEGEMQHARELIDMGEGEVKQLEGIIKKLSWGGKKME
jgi:hypothetical protein